PELKPTYDVVIVGGGAHGLAIAYELAKRGITQVAVLERSYIGAGGSGRNTTIIRANYRTPEGVAFYKQALRLYEHLAQELDYNLLLSQQGHLTLAHAERAVIVAHERAEVDRLLGVDSRRISPEIAGARLQPPPFAAGAPHARARRTRGDRRARARRGEPVARRRFPRHLPRDRRSSITTSSFRSRGTSRSRTPNAR